MDDESIIIVWQIIEHMIMMVEISWQKLCIPVFDSIWRQFGSGFRVFKEAFRGSVFFFFFWRCGSYSSKVEVGCLLPDASSCSRWVSICINVKSTSWCQNSDFSKFPFIWFWKDLAMVRQWKKKPIAPGTGRDPEVNQNSNGWTFEAFLGFVRMAEDEACHQDLLDEERGSTG